MDTTTSRGKLIFHVFGAFAESEREVIRERKNVALRAARERGRNGGRPAKMDARKITLARTLSDTNLTITAMFVLYLWHMTALGAVKSLPQNQLSADGRKAYDILVAAEQFEGEFTGYTLQPSKFVQAYRELLEQDQADRAFKNLLIEATPAGQLYALCGIYFTDYGFFLEVIDEYRKRGDSVMTQFGCIRGRMPIKELVEKKSPNVVRLSSPAQTIDDWKRHNPQIAKGPFMLDIAGGGYPSVFCRRRP